MKTTILLVDDDYSVRRSLAKLLELENYAVLSARDGEEAIGFFRFNRVDLVVLDLNLAGEDGWEIFERMKELKPSVPTVIITAEFDQRESAIAHGAEALIEKPMDVPNFIEVIDDLIAKASAKRLKRVCGDANYCRFIARYYESSGGAREIVIGRRAHPLRKKAEAA